MATVKCPRCGAESREFVCSCGLVLQTPDSEANPDDLAGHGSEAAVRASPSLGGASGDLRQGVEAIVGGQVPRASDGPLGLAISLAALIGLIGFGIGNWYPLWGNFLAKNLAEPLSPARIQLGYEHAVAGAVLGLILGALGGRRR